MMRVVQCLLVAALGTTAMGAATVLRIDPSFCASAQQQTFPLAGTAPPIQCPGTCGIPGPACKEHSFPDPGTSTLHFCGCAGFGGRAGLCRIVRKETPVRGGKQSTYFCSRVNCTTECLDTGGISLGPPPVILVRCVCQP